MADSKRQSGGRFAKGNPGGPGRPRREREIAYLRTMHDLCPLEKWERIVERAVLDALAGDWRARNWLSAYLVGQPSGEAQRLSEEERRGRMAELYPDVCDITV